MTFNAHSLQLICLEDAHTDLVSTKRAVFMDRVLIQQIKSSKMAHIKDLEHNFGLKSSKRNQYKDLKEIYPQTCRF